MATSPVLPGVRTFALPAALTAPRRYWLPALVAVGVVAAVSQNMLGTERTAAWLAAATGGSGHAHALRTLNILLRKGGHFCGYGMVALCFYVGWFQQQFRRCPELRRVLPWTTIYWRPAVRAVASAFAVACVDELHQIYLPARTASVRDVMVDTAGATVFAVWVCSALILRCLIGGSYRRWMVAFFHAPKPGDRRS